MIGATIFFANVLNEACISMVMSRLPFAWLKTHVMMIVRAVIMTMNIRMFGIVGGVHTPVQNRGRGHSAHSTPRMTLPTSGPYRRCKRGSAKPRQPGSSPSGPPSRNVVAKARGYASTIVSVSG